MENHGLDAVDFAAVEDADLATLFRDGHGDGELAARADGLADHLKFCRVVFVYRKHGCCVRASLWEGQLMAKRLWKLGRTLMVKTLCPATLMAPWEKNGSGPRGLAWPCAPEDEARSAQL
jgi:hypothetical protein